VLAAMDKEGTRWVKEKSSKEEGKAGRDLS